jgi:hypothetical protein
MKIIPTTAFILGGLWFLYDGLKTNNQNEILIGIGLAGVGAFLQYYYLKRKFKE